MKKIIYIWCLVLLFGCKGTTKKEVIQNVDFVSLSTKKTYKAGDAIHLKFSYTKSSKAVLILKNAMGSTALIPQVLNKTLEFEVPSSFNRYAGMCHWSLIYNQDVVVSGDLSILPNSSETHIESYLGPRSISAGEVDYSMMVIAPTDGYDNPLSAGTEVQMKHQFENAIQEHTLEVKNLLTWKNIYAPTKSGRILVTASCNSTISKELTSIVFPDKAIDFSINYERNHSYADGNQMITFETSIIYDAYGNIISDGTLVSFLIEDTSGMLLRAMGTTINGIAKARLLHPTKKESWKISGYITGVAKSNTISVSFDAAILDYKIGLSANKRTVMVGPLESFMQQIVPDGMPISLHIWDSEKNLLEIKQTTSRLGMGEFNLSPEFFPNGTYEITIEVSGLKKTKKLVLE